MGTRIPEGEQSDLKKSYKRGVMKNLQTTENTDQNFTESLHTWFMRVSLRRNDVITQRSIIEELKYTFNM